MLSEINGKLLVAELASSIYDGLSMGQAYGKLHDQPPEIQTVEEPAQLTLGEFWGALSAGSKQTLSGHVHLLDIRDKIKSQDRAGVGFWVTVLRDGGAITADEAAAFSGLLAATESTQVTNPGVPRIHAAFHGVAGFPNRVDEADFESAWNSARG